MMKKFFLTSIALLVSLVSVNAQEQEILNSMNFDYQYYTKYKQSSYGIKYTLIKPNGIGFDFGVRALYHKEGITQRIYKDEKWEEHKLVEKERSLDLDLGINYSYELMNANDLSAFITVAAGPSLGLDRNVYILPIPNKDDKDYTHMHEGCQKYTVNGFVNPRISMKYKNIMVSVGYYWWAEKFNFSRPGAINASFGYAF